MANTAFGATSFLALEAIGGAIALSYGFSNALWAILVVGLITFLTGLPISYYAAKYGLDMDLLTRGAGFGYLGSTITSLVYASFTFIFFALEAAILALALQMWLDWPLAVCYLIASLGVVPLVMHGITLISRLQLWTQPVWIVLFVLPYRRGGTARARSASANSPRLAGRLSGNSGFDAADVRCGRHGGLLAGGADRRAGRLPALSAREDGTRTAGAGGRRCWWPARAGSSRAC